jgi:putative alpha-1,2-mannosidase
VVRHVDNRTAEVVLSDGSTEHTHYFYIVFSVPAMGRGTFTPTAVHRNATMIAGDHIGAYVTFAPGTDVTVAVALSMTSMSRAEQNFRTEFRTFAFAGAVARLKRAWNARLDHVVVRRAPTLAIKQIYTGLYSVYANIIDVTDNPTGYVPVAGSRRLLTIGSSPFWEYEGGGYLRSSFDQGRNVYAMLTLVDPAVMADILNTYLAQYNRDGYLYGNWDPFSVRARADQQWGFFSYYFLRAKLQGVSGVDYKAAETAILHTEGKTATALYASRCGFYEYGYVPADICSSNYVSRGMELSPQLAGLAHLAYVIGDTRTYRAYIRYGTAYLSTWNAARKVFQGKNSHRGWAPLNGGFFEGDTRSYAFDEPHDGIGLANLYGDRTMTSDLASTYAVRGYDYNDYQLSQPYLAVESDSPSTAQDIVRNYFLPEFDCLYIAENPPCGGSWYYTDNASALVLANLGLYPLQSPGAAWVINSPAVTTAVIYGATKLSNRAPTNSPGAAYVTSLHLNDAVFPSHLISGETLVKRANTLAFGMTSRPARIGRMYVTAADGEVLSATTDSNSYLQFRNSPLGGISRVEVYSVRRPLAVSVNEAPLPASDWSYDASERIMSIGGLSSGTVRIRFAA